MKAEIKNTRQKLYRSYKISCKRVITLSKLVLVIFIINGVFLSALLNLLEVFVFLNEHKWINFSSSFAEEVTLNTNSDTLKFLLNYSKILPFMFFSVVTGAFLTTSFFVLSNVLLITIYRLKISIYLCKILISRIH